MFSNIVMINYARPLAERAKARKLVGPYRWNPSKPGTGRGFYQDSRSLECDPRGSTFALRLEEANEHLSGSRLAMTDGYYCDLDCEGETLQPIIARLAHGRGFLPGWTMGNGMCATLDSRICSDEREAAYAAHQLAEHDAESSQQSQWEEREAERLAEESEDDE